MNPNERWILVEETQKIALKKSHVFAAAALLAVSVTAAVALGIGYSHTKAALEQTQAENQTYSAEIATLEEKAAEIEATLTELSAAKEELYQKLQELDGPAAQDPQSEAQDPAPASAAAADETATAQSKVSSILDALSKLEQNAAREAHAYEGVTQDVIETLAYIESIPDGAPLNGIFSSGFGYRTDPITGKSSLHTGVDLRAKIGTPVAVTASGVVIESKYHDTYGNYVEVDHGNGYVTLYAHCSELLVGIGDRVEKGDIVALSGATGRVTGAHVHYEVKLNGEYQDPMDYLELEQ